MARRVAQVIAFVVFMNALPVSAYIAGPYVLMLDRGFGWQEAGQFDDLRECETEAAQSAKVYRARAGCTTARAFERWQSGITFEQVVLSCANTSGARIVVAPGRQVDVFGTEQAALEFDGCMRAWSGAIQKQR